MSGAVFGGLTSLINDVFGGPVRYLPKGGDTREIESVFRDTPTEVEDRDGRGVVIMAPTWRVPKHLVPEIAEGDRIVPGLAGRKIYEITSFAPSGSPADDAFVICELVRIIP